MIDTKREVALFLIAGMIEGQMKWCHKCKRVYSSEMKHCMFCKCRCGKPLNVEGVCSKNPLGAKTGELLKHHIGNLGHYSNEHGWRWWADEK